MKKYIFYILIIIMLVGIFSPFFAVHAETNFEHCVTSETSRGITDVQAQLDCRNTANPNVNYVDPVGTCTYPSDYNSGSGGSEQLTQSDCQGAGGTFSAPYVLLAPLPCNSTDANCVNGQLTAFDPSSTSGDKISGYLNLMIKIFIGLCAVLAVVMIVIGGIEYMTTELISSKEAGKERIRGAIFGLLLALGAWTLLNQINPDILNTDLSSLKDVTVDVALQSNSIYEKPVTAANIARCTPITSGPCATANLSTFGAKAEGMSKICNIESGGIATNNSQTDFGIDNRAFSFGLFQINLLANGAYVKDSQGKTCEGIFETSSGQTAGGGNYIKKNSSGKTYYDAKIKSGMEQRYNDCAATLKDPTKNIAVAKTLFNYSNGQKIAWGGDIPVCASAFQ